MLLALGRSGLPCNARRTTSAAAQSRQLTFPSSGLELPPVQLPLCERDVCSEESAYAFLQCRQQCRELSEDRVRIDLDKDAPSTSDLHVWRDSEQAHIASLTAPCNAAPSSAIHLSEYCSFACSGNWIGSWTTLWPVARKQTALLCLGGSYPLCHEPSRTDPSECGCARR